MHNEVQICYNNIRTSNIHTL